MTMNMALDAGAYFENVVLTFILVVTFIVLVLAFLYMIYGKSETPAATAATPKTKT